MPRPFSERMGIVQPRTVLQVDDIDDGLRNSIWNLLHRHLWGMHSFMGYDKVRGIFEFSREWWEHAKLPVDDRPDNPNVLLSVIRTWYFGAEWFRVHEFREFVISYLNRICSIGSAEACVEDVNALMESELAGYRFVMGQFIPVTDPQEIEEIQEALQSTPYAGVRAHLGRTVEHMSHRVHPDFRNSIKEPISAVEAVCRELTGNPKPHLETLTDCSRRMECFTQP